MEEVKDGQRSLGELIPKVFSSDALTIAVLSVLGTTATYFVENGYLGYYNVPRSLIEINITRIVLSCALIGFVISVFMTMTLMVLGMLEGKHPIKRALVAPTFFILILAMLGFLSGQWVHALIGSLCVLVVAFLPPLLQKDPGTSYLERLVTDLEKRPAVMARRFGLMGVVAIFILCYLIAIFLYGLGQKIAESRELYYVLADEPEMALVDTYGDVAILVAFDPESRQIKPFSRVLRLNEPLDLVQVNTGPLLRSELESGVCDFANLAGWRASGGSLFRCIRQPTPDA